jgi:3-methyladenine DNA glycosylase AlkC
VYTGRVAEPLKHRFFQRPFFEELAEQIRRVHPRFDGAHFLAEIYDGTWDELELKARLRRAAEALGAALPRDYAKAISILLKVERHFSGFDHLVFAEVVERCGVDHYEPSMAALEVFTRSSAEFAVRPFLRRYPRRAFAQMLAWTRHESEHVRRLASEGCRPRLPWASALDELKRDPSPILPILERLKDDPSEYVRRSVANNLGDIAKDHPELAVDVAARWLAESESRRPLVKHALRDLLKKGHRRALHLFGVGDKPAVEVEALEVTPKRVALGGAATLTVSIRARRKTAQRLRLEYAMTYARPAGRTGRKVFKIAEVELLGGARLSLTRKLSFVDRSIRKHHAGLHVVTLLANGHPLAEARLRLT